MKTKLKPYMVFNRHDHPSEGALLVFHFTSRQARYLGWQSEPLMGCDSYIDATAKLIRDPEDAYPLTEARWLKGDHPHAIENPECCQACEFWGLGMDGNGRCNGCGEPVGERLLGKFQKWKEDGHGAEIEL